MSDDNALAPIIHEGEIVGEQPAGFVRVLCLHNVFTLERTDTRVPEGQTLGAILRDLNLPGWQSAIVALDGDVVPRGWWDLVRPKAGHVVTVRAIPRGGGDSSNKGWIQIVAGVLLVVVGILTLQYGIGGYLITMGIGLIASGALTLIFPPPGAPKLNSGSGGDAPVFSLTGTRNIADPYGAVPKILGQHRQLSERSHPMSATTTDTRVIRYVEAGELFTPLVRGGRFLAPDDVSALAATPAPGPPRRSRCIVATESTPR